VLFLSRISSDKWALTTTLRVIRLRMYDTASRYVGQRHVY